MADVYLNRIATAVPANDLHARFVDCGHLMLKDQREQALFKRMAKRSQIEHRYSVLCPASDDGLVDREDFYLPGAFPDTAKRMDMYRREAFGLAKKALDQLGLKDLDPGPSHLLLTSCTGFHAPGVDLDIMDHYGLSPAMERSILGFMGCAAAINALKAARHIVRSDPEAQVLVVNLELCTLHFQETDNLEQALSFLLFADGCAASLVSARARGIRMRGFHSLILAHSRELITWRIGRYGFDMELSGQVPGLIAASLPQSLPDLLMGVPAEDVRLWAVHPGGRTILDAVQRGTGLDDTALAASREVLRRFGNMSSPTVMFVLSDLMDSPSRGPGLAVAFGPGLCVEGMAFEKGAV